MDADEATAWLAGVLDAGGTIRVGGSPRRGTYYAVVAVNSRSLDFLARVRAVAGAGAIAVSKPATETYAAGYRWGAEARDAADILRRVRPLLIAQAAAADVAIAVQDIQADSARPKRRPEEAEAELARLRATTSRGRGARRRLTDVQVAEIRALRGTTTQRDIAARYGVSAATISKLLRAT